MMWLDELIIKLFCFFLVGYVFAAVEVLFLSLTEDIPLKKELFSIFNFFPISYGIFLPIFNFLVSQPYYPVGSTKIKKFHFSFEIEHTSSKLFAYLFLILLFCTAMELTTLYYHSFHPLFLVYLGWFYQVFLSFLIFQLLPLYPTLMGLAILKELKNYFVRSNKIQYISYFTLIAEITSFLFILVGISMNYFLFNENLKNFITLIIRFLNSGAFFALIGCIVLIMVVLFYVKKREYSEYLAYIRNILKEAILKDSSKSPR